ncbi:ADP-ribosylglycohydrolase family protein [Jonesiaceae bacterium BS-20]|uniref:ADP-ribosylglycohydrolase family protein n=1 Tax=Jonesiaceae bacterium BS-20 TaxID=3120821 RepID=A0AAU7DVT1_9MICO
MSVQTDYLERTYAGVLGKIIGVYLGRPVEGWPYQDIIDRFGQVRHYVNAELGIPVVTADDDISGSLAFSRAVVDHAGHGQLTPQQVGETWLNYIVEDKTILWWGGRGRSTEHTAFLNLQEGLSAPQSGSFATNGSTLPVQVGAQIFIDPFAMMSPGNPDRAVALTRAAAQVSHDGVAVEAATFIAALESGAYLERDLDKLIAKARTYITDQTLQQIITDVQAWCVEHDDWRVVRDLIEDNYGYSVFAGPCPVTTNCAAVVAALLCGKDSFHGAVSIAASAGWDTDSNAGVVGAINGIRLGLAAISRDAELRTPVADQLLVVTADGGECVSDAVREVRGIDQARRVLDGEVQAERQPRFGFELPGSVQGFQECTRVSSPYATLEVANVSEHGSEQGTTGLRLACKGLSDGVIAAASTPVFIPKPGPGDNFSTLGSPTLYSGQTVRVRARVEQNNGQASPALQPYILVESEAGFEEVYGTATLLGVHGQELQWLVPNVGNNPIIKFGLAVVGRGRFDGAVVVEQVDWSGAPKYLSQAGILMESIWDLTPSPLRAWVSSAKNFEADFRVAYSVSHPRGTGVVTTGTRDWDNYTFSSTLIFNPHENGGVVVRARGHNRYYAAIFTSWNTVELIRRNHGETQVLGLARFEYAEDQPVQVSLSAIGRDLHVRINGDLVLEAHDSSGQAHLSGGAGFMVTGGTMLADGFTVTTAEQVTA